MLMVNELRGLFKRILEVRLGQIFEWLLILALAPAVLLFLALREGMKSFREVASEIADAETVWRKIKASIWVLIWSLFALGIFFAICKYVIVFYAWVIGLDVSRWID